MWHGRPASASLRLPPSGVLWLAPENASPEQAADIGQAAPVAPFAPEVVGDTTPAAPATPVVPDSPAGLSDAPELTSGDGALVDEPASDGADDSADDSADVDPAYALDDADDATAPVAPAGAETDGTAPPVPTATDQDVDAGPVPSATDADAPHFPDEAPDELVEQHADLLDAAPSAGVTADAPVVAPEVPQVEVSPLGTGPEDVPPDAAYEDESPLLERTPGSPDVVADEPRFSTEEAERPLPASGRPDTLDTATPSATSEPTTSEPAGSEAASPEEPAVPESASPERDGSGR
jgi:hypothetical protein